jgi:hypothetical protein
MKISHIIFAAGVLLTASLCSAQNTVLQSAEAQNGTNGIVFGTNGDSRWSDMQRRMADPEERKKLRAQARDGLPAQYPDLADVLHIDAEAEGKLLDLLADEQMARQEQMFAPAPNGAHPSAPNARSRPGFPMLDDMARLETESKERIRKLLGEEAFEQYLQYDTTRMERMEVARFNERLAPADKLAMDQKDNMMAVVREHQQRLYSRPGWHIPDFGPMGNLNSYLRMSEQERQAVMLKRNIELNEDNVRRQREEKAVLLEQVRPILNARQLQGFSQWQDDRIAMARNSVRKMRASAGMNPEFDENLPSKTFDAPERFEGKVRLRVAFTVDGNPPVVMDVTTDNGKAAPQFEIAPKLWAEATPVLYASGDGNVALKYYEERNGTHQPLRGGGGIGTSNRDASIPLGRGGGGGGPVSGSKAYSVMTEARLTPAP